MNTNTSVQKIIPFISPTWNWAGSRNWDCGLFYIICYGCDAQFDAVRIFSL